MLVSETERVIGAVLLFWVCGMSLVAGAIMRELLVITIGSSTTTIESLNTIGLIILDETEDLLERSFGFASLVFSFRVSLGVLVAFNGVILSLLVECRSSLRAEMGATLVCLETRALLTCFEGGGIRDNWGRT